MNKIHWKLHLSSPPDEVFIHLTSNEGREKFWAESANSVDKKIQFKFINGIRYESKVIKSNFPHLFEIDYFNTIVRFELFDDGFGGTDLNLINTSVPDEEYHDIYAGWVSVLMALKAAVDFGIDLRNHDPVRTWDNGFVEN